MQTKVLSNFEKLILVLVTQVKFIWSSLSHIPTTMHYASIQTDKGVTFIFLGEIQIHNEKQ